MEALLATQIEEPAAGSAGSVGIGGLALSIGGTPIAEFSPAPQVILRKGDGPPLVPGADWQRLDPGVYRLRIETGANVIAEQMVHIEAGEVTDLDVPLAAQPTPGMAATVSMAHIRINGDGRVAPSESLGWLAGSLATLVAIAASKATQGNSYMAEALGLDTEWPGTGEGVQFVIADESGSAEAGSGQMPDLLPTARLWRMFKANSEIHAEMRKGMSPEVLTTCRLPAPTGGHWFQLLTPDAGAAGFKVATFVAPLHRSLVFCHLVAAGRVELLQFELPVARWEAESASDFYPSQIVNRALVEAEVVQRALLRGEDPLAIAALDAMLALDWSEPFTSWAVAARLLERDDSDAAALLDRMVTSGAIDRLGASVEAAVIHGVRAERRGNSGIARAYFEAAASDARVPVVGRLLYTLVTAMARHEIKGAVPIWLRAKALQSVDHPLWTFRRADDKRGDQIPAAE